MILIPRLNEARKHLPDFKCVLSTLQEPGAAGTPVFLPSLSTGGAEQGGSEPRVQQRAQQDLWEEKGPAFFSVINKEKTRNLLEAPVEAFPLSVSGLMGSFQAKFQHDRCCRYHFLGGSHPARGPLWFPSPPMDRGQRRHPGWKIFSLCPAPGRGDPAEMFGGHAVDGSGAVTLPGRKPSEIGVCRGRSQMGTAGRGGTLCWSPCFERYAIVCRGGDRNGVRFPARVGNRLAGSQGLALDENREVKGAGIRAGKND